MKCTTLLGLCMAFSMSYLTIKAQAPNPQVLDQTFEEREIFYPNGDVKNKFLYREMLFWRPRIMPHGDPSIPARAIQAYAREFHKQQEAPIANKLISTPITQANWQPLGPTGVDGQSFSGARGIGRINRIAFSPNFATDNTMYASSSKGGLWRSTNGGDDWAVFGTDYQIPNPGVADVFVHPTAPDTIYMATGDTDYRVPLPREPWVEEGYNLVYTSGIYKGVISSDGAVTWTPFNGDPTGPSSGYFLDDFEEGGAINRITGRIDPNDPSKLNLLICSSQGIFKTENAHGTGAQVEWEKVLANDNNIIDTFSHKKDESFRNIAFSHYPGQENHVYASGHDLYKSTDNGDTWQRITGQGTAIDWNGGSIGGHTFPTDITIKRMNIATTADNPDQLYIYTMGIREWQTVCNNISPNNWTNTYLFLYDMKNDNFDLKHHRTGQCQNEFRYNRMGFAVDPGNKDFVLHGGRLLHHSFTYTTTSIFPVQTISSTGSFIHDDIHAIEFAPGVAHTFYVGHDGGITKCVHTSGTSFSKTPKSKGLQVGRIWGFDDSEFDENKAFLSFQDGGNMRSSDRNLNGELIWSYIYPQEDGYGIQASDVKLKDGQGNWQEVVFYRSNKKSLLKSFYNENNVNDDYFWSNSGILPKEPRTNESCIISHGFRLINDPHSGRLYFNFSEIFSISKLKKFGTQNNNNNPWECRTSLACQALVYPPPSNDPKPSERDRRAQNVMEINLGNPDVAYLANFPHPYHSAYEDPSDPNYPHLLYKHVGLRTCSLPAQSAPDSIACQCGTQDITKNLMDALTDSVSGVQLYDYNMQWGTRPAVTFNSPSPITDIATDPNNENRVWLSFSGYLPEVKVWMSTNGGNDWVNADPNGTLPNMPVNCIEYQNGSNDRLFVGTDVGVFYRKSNGDWERYGTDCPNFYVMDIKINACAAKMRVSTYGRGLWEADIPDVNDLGGDRIISSNLTWPDTLEEISVKTDIVVKSGAILTVKGKLGMPARGRILIEKGAKLIVDGGTITNFCGEMWEGIEAYGDDALPQHQTGGSPQAWVVLDSAVIEHARNAIATYEEFVSNTGGAVIQATGTEFLNNRRSIEFVSYSAPGGVDNMSFFDDCDFIINDAYRGYTPFLTHVSMSNVKGIEFKDCDFKNETSPGFSSDIHGYTVEFNSQRGTGIYSENADYRILTDVNPSSEFYGLGRGIHAQPGTFAFTVDNASFTRNWIGINTSYVDNFSVTNCDFEIGNIIDQSDPSDAESKLITGISLSTGTGFTIEENTFTGDNPLPFTNLITYGIRVDNTGTSSNEIFGNSFTLLKFANEANSTNRNSSDPNQGLVYRCNENSMNEQDFYVTGSLAHQGMVNGPVNNTFSHNPVVSLESDFNNLGLFPINYRYDGIGALPNPLHPEYTSPTAPPNITFQRFPVGGIPNGDPCSSGQAGTGRIVPFSMKSANAQYLTIISNLEKASSSSEQGELEWKRQKLCNSAIRTLLSHPDTLSYGDVISWYRRLGTLEAHYALTRVYSRIGKWKQGDALSDSIPLTHDLTPEQFEEFYWFKEIYRILWKQAKLGKSAKNLDEATQARVIQIKNERPCIASMYAHYLLGETYYAPYTPRKMHNTLLQETIRGEWIKLVPNPARDQVSAYLGYEKESPSQLEIVDLQGRIFIQKAVLGERLIPISTAELPAGVYLCTVKWESGKILTEKLVIFK
ncbi:MAG: T9SS type A sorting domain-containing protein [Bacteroidota bacterium]